jgi:hypothetical protein
MPSMEGAKVEDSPFYESFMKMHSGLVDAVRNYGGFEKYADKIEKWNKSKLMTQFMDISEPMRCGFVVMNHGDPWLNNVMFKSDADGKSTECKLIDFQMPFWAGPSFDLMYFLFSSVHDDIKVDHFDDFIEFYHAELSSGLSKLGYDQHIPTLSEIHVDLLDKGAFGNFLSFRCSKSFLTETFFLHSVLMPHGNFIHCKIRLRGRDQHGNLHEWRKQPRTAQENLR